MVGFEVKRSLKERKSFLAIGLPVYLYLKNSTCFMSFVKKLLLNVDCCEETEVYQSLHAYLPTFMYMCVMNLPLKISSIRGNSCLSRWVKYHYQGKGPEVLGNGVGWPHGMAGKSSHH